MKNFKQLIKELPSKKVVFAFGRFQPPTTGHELLIKAVKKVAGSSADHVIYASKTEDKKDNPLPVDRKVYFLKRMFPGTNFKAADQNVRTFIEATKELNKKYKNIVMVAGSDRVQEYTKILEKYNGSEFHFDTIEVVSAGERDPDSDSASGMSGTKMREAAKSGDFKKFKKGVPYNLTDLDSRRLMNDIRSAYGLDVIKEAVEFSRSSIREQYISGSIFNVGDKVQDENGTYEIMDRGANYITVVNESGQLSKKWIDKVTAIETVQEDIPGGYAPSEITFKGYTTKNLHHSADAAKAFQQTIAKYDGHIIKDGVAVLNALKATDAYMKLNDLHLEQSKPPDETELHEWVSAHMKAKESLERIGEFMHHMDYWDSHGHELQMMLMDYKDKGDPTESFKIEGTMVQEELKFAAADKVKVARIIAATFGVEHAEKGTSPEQLVNAGLRKIRNKAFTPDMAKVVRNMLETARLAGIQFDEKLLPTKVAAVTEGADPVETKKIMTSYKEYLKKAGSSELPVEIPDAKQKKSMQTDDDDMDPNDHDDQPNQSDMDTKSKDEKPAEPHTKTGFLMQRPFDDNENLRRQKIKYRLGESYDEAEKHLSLANDADAKGDKATFHAHMADHHDAMSEWHDSKGRSASADKHAEKADYHHEKSLTVKEDIYTSDTQSKDYQTKDAEGNWVWHKRKVHPKRVTFAASKMGGSPDQKSQQDEAYVSEAADHEHPYNRPHDEPSVSHSKLKAGEHARAPYNRIVFGGALSKMWHAKNKSGQVKAFVNSDAAKKHALSEQFELDEAKDYHGLTAKIHKHAYDLGHEKNSSMVRSVQFNHKSNGHKEDSSEIHTGSGKQMFSNQSQPSHKSEDVVSHYLKKAGGNTSSNYDDHHQKIGKYHYHVKKTSDGHTIKITHASNNEEVELDESTYPTAEAAKSIADKLKTKHEDGNYQVKQTKNGHKVVHAYYGDTKVKNDIKKIAEETKTFGSWLQDQESTISYTSEELKKKVKKTKVDSDKDTFDPKNAGGSPPFDPFFEEVEDKEDHISDQEIDKMVDKLDKLEDILDVYEDDEIELVDSETGEVIKHDDIKEELVSEVLSRSERLRAKVRFAQSASKRKRAIKISLRSRSSTSKINIRARRLAITLMKQRIAKKPLSSLSIGEKERIEKIIQRRKKVIARIAMKLTSRIRKIENDRMGHKKK